MDQPSVLIIGAGIGGLSAGTYLQMNGYRVRILEMHTRPGGMCTAWTRHGYTFDGCIHNLAGTAPGAVQRMWQDLGVAPTIGFHRYGEMVRVERPDGPPLIVYSDLDKFAAHLKSLAPVDGAAIDELIAGARKFAALDLLGLGLADVWTRAKAAASMLGLFKFNGMTLEQFAAKFSSPFLQRAFPTLVYDWPQSPVFMLMSFLGRLHVGDFGWAKGGSARFAEAIAARFATLGGHIDYQAKVASIIVEDGRARGVRLADGHELRADVVISNANGHATIFDMLGGQFMSAAVRAYYGRPTDRIEMGVHVSLGVNRDLSREPHAIVLPLAQPVEIAGEPRARLFVETFGFDESLAPAGKGVLKVVFATGYRQWETLARDHERYHAEKKRIADAVIAQLEPRFPGIGAQVEVVDVATPVTTQRFTGNAHGYQAGVADMLLMVTLGRHLSATLPGLRDFYMVGQWAGAPSLPLVATMGRDIARLICRRDGRTFRTDAPAVAVRPIKAAA